MNTLRKTKLFLLYGLLSITIGCSESVSLPYDLKLTNNSSYLWIINYDEWCIVCEIGTLEGDQYGQIEISKLLRYLEASNGLYVEFRSGKDEIWYVIVTPKDENNYSFNRNVMDAQEFVIWANAPVDNLQWKDFR